MKYSSFDYQYFWSIISFFNEDAFGFWKFWYAEAVEDWNFKLLRTLTQKPSNAGENTK